MANLITRNIPNAITCCNLISGCVAVTYALSADYRLALIFIIVGAIFDFFDGMTARLLHVSSPIGKELDSLADVVTFGVAPSAMLFTLLHMLTYPAFLEPLRPFLPYIAFVMAAFSALRLAKFKIDERQHSSFIGLPTPANALFWASLIVGAETFIINLRFSLPLLLLLLCVSCWLLVSGIHMFALKFKQWGWHTNQVKYIFVLTCIPMLAIFGVTGIAIIIAWYIILSAFSSKLPTE